VDISVQELAVLVGGRVAESPGDRRFKSARIAGAASISDAGDGDVTFFGNQKYLTALKTSRATCALVPDDFQEEIAAIPIYVANPTVAFSRVLAHFAPPPAVVVPGVHPSAIIGECVQLGPDVSIQPYAVIEAGAVIGEGSFIGAGVYIGRQVKLGANCKIYPNATILERCILGNRVVVHSGTVIGGDGFGFELVKGRHVKIPQTGIVQIEDDVEIGANAAIDRARFGRTRIGEGTKIDNLVQIAHNVTIGKHVILVAQVGISGSSRVGDYATLAGQVGVVGHIEIGEYAVVGAQGGVSKSVPPRQFVWGTPACPMKEFKVRNAHAVRLPGLVGRVKQLEKLVEKLSRQLGESPDADAE